MVCPNQLEIMVRLLFASTAPGLRRLWSVGVVIFSSAVTQRRKAEASYRAGPTRLDPVWTPSMAAAIIDQCLGVPISTDAKHRVIVGFNRRFDSGRQAH
jgi:hypothetical protein